MNLIDTTLVAWAEDTDEDGRQFDGFLGMETCINLKVEKRPAATAATSRAYNVDVVRVTSDELIEGVRYPQDQIFAGETRFMTINFPASGYWAAEQNPLNLQDPFTKPYCVTPQVRDVSMVILILISIAASEWVGLREFRKEKPDERDASVGVCERSKKCTPSYSDTLLAFLCEENGVWTRLSPLH